MESLLESKVRRIVRKMLKEEVGMDSILEKAKKIDPNAKAWNVTKDGWIITLVPNKYGLTEEGIEIQLSDNKIYLQPFFDGKLTPKQTDVIKYILKNIPEIGYIYDNQKDIEYRKIRFNDYFDSFIY